MHLCILSSMHFFYIYEANSRIKSSIGSVLFAGRRVENVTTSNGNNRDFRSYQFEMHNLVLELVGLGFV